MQMQREHSDRGFTTGASKSIASGSPGPSSTARNESVNSLGQRPLEEFGRIVEHS